MITPQDTAIIRHSANRHRAASDAERAVAAIRRDARAKRRAGRFAKVTEALAALLARRRTTGA